MSVPDSAVGVYWELWCPTSEQTRSENVDDEGYKLVGTGSEVFLGKANHSLEDYTKEAIESRKSDGWKVKNHKWLYTKEEVENRE